MMEEILIVNNLRKTFKLTAKQRKINKTDDLYKVAVDGLSFKAYKGEIYGLLGPNGAGKTTTLRIISTLIKADSGNVLVDNIDIAKNPDMVRQRIGFLTSELKLEDFFTPNYLYDYFSALHKIEKDVSDQRKNYLFKKIGDLSTGMKQKVSLVISIVHNPEIIIFDEPTNGLDVITAKSVTDFLIELKKEGKTIILSTHIFSLVEKLCDRVGIIFDGKMVKDDSLTNLTKEKTLEDVFFELYDERIGDKYE